MTIFCLRPFVNPGLDIHVVLPNEQVSDVTIFQVMFILILSDDNWYLAINGNY